MAWFVWVGDLSSKIPGCFASSAMLFREHAAGGLSRFPIFEPLYAVISKLLLHATAQPGFIRAVRASHALQEPTAAMAKEVWRDA